MGVVGVICLVVAVIIIIKLLPKGIGSRQSDLLKLTIGNQKEHAEIKESIVKVNETCKSISSNHKTILDNVAWKGETEAKMEGQNNQIKTLTSLVTKFLENWTRVTEELGKLAKELARKNGTA
jgi:hypothetical protein